MLSSFVKSLFLAMVLLSETHAFGDTQLGNGGDAVICGPNVELLDLHEGFQLQQPFAINLPGQGVNEKLSNVIKRFPGPYQAALKQYQKRLHIEFGVPATIDDEDVYMVKAGCHKAQLIRQAKPQSPSAPIRLTIDPLLYERMDDDHKTAALLHELLIALSVDFHHTRSSGVRRFVRLAVSQEFFRLNHRKQEQRNLLNELGFRPGF